VLVSSRRNLSTLPGHCAIERLPVLSGQIGCSSYGDGRVSVRDADEFILWAFHLIIMLYKHRKCQL